MYRSGNGRAKLPGVSKRAITTHVMVMVNKAVDWIGTTGLNCR